MKILIVEDEPLAVAQLRKLLSQIEPEAVVVAECDTVDSTLKWFENNPLPDLAFFDIQLGDGLSFEIFKKTNIDVPVIFTTAFDQYAIQAFKVNSIDYLLKPIDKEELAAAMNKFSLRQANTSQSVTPALIQSLIDSASKTHYKKRFLVKIGDKLRTVESSSVCYFYSYQKGTFMKTDDGRNYLLDITLEVIEELIDPGQFFRINRKYLIALNSIVEMYPYSNSRLKLKLKNQEDDDFLVAREKVKAFKEWLEGGN